LETHRNSRIGTLIVAGLTLELNNVSTLCSSASTISACHYIDEATGSDRGDGLSPPDGHLRELRQRVALKYKEIAFAEPRLPRAA
jgi:hypothetical protein